MLSLPRTGFQIAKTSIKIPYARDTPLPPLLCNFPAVPLGQWKSVPEDTSHANFLRFQSYLENQRNKESEPQGHMEPFLFRKTSDSL